MESKKRKPRSDKGIIVITERDIAVLSWIGEQFTVNVAMLRKILGLYSPTGDTRSLNASNTNRMVQRWKKQGLIEVEKIGGKRYVWLSKKGLNDVGLPYAYWRMKYGHQDKKHMEFINLVRHYIFSQHPNRSAFAWVSERLLRREKGLKRTEDKVPDGLLTINGQSSIAIEVELSRKTPERLNTKLTLLASDYPKTWYFVEEDLRGLVSSRIEALPSNQAKQFTVIPLSKVLDNA